MKTKSFAMLAVTGLLAASIANILPAMAEESSNEMPMEQTLADNSNLQPPADNSSAGSAIQPPADNNASGGLSNSGTSQGDINGNVGGISPSAPGPNNNEEGSPDTATGDDDY